MGSLASGVFSTMLGWLRTAASQLWNAATSPQGSTLLQWITDNWLTLTVILCVFCATVDMIVHLLRWRSHKVWASFFRRLRGVEQEEPVYRAKRRVERQWLYADGTARTEAVLHEELPPEEELLPWQDVTPNLPDYELDQEAYRRQFARPEPDPVQESYLPPVEQLQPQEEETPRDTGRRRRISRESAAAALQQLFAGHDEDELDLRYKPVQPAVDKQQAYNKPYYPPQWKPPAEVGAAGRDE